MDASKFTNADFGIFAERANEAHGMEPGPFDAACARSAIAADQVRGMSSWGVAVRAMAREALVAKQDAKKTLRPWGDIADALAAAMRGATPKAEIVNKEARGFETLIGADYQGDGRPYVSISLAPLPDTAFLAAYEDLLRGLGAGAPILLPAKPDPTTAPLDAMLRLLCGHPQGPRWIGARLYLEVQRIARRFRPDAQVEHRYTAGMAASLLGVCEQFDPGSTARFLDRQEQQEYLRLFDALRVAVNAVPASGVR